MQYDFLRMMGEQRALPLQFTVKLTEYPSRQTLNVHIRLWCLCGCDLRLDLSLLYNQNIQTLFARAISYSKA